MLLNSRPYDLVLALMSSFSILVYLRYRPGLLPSHKSSCLHSLLSTSLLFGLSLVLCVSKVNQILLLCLEVFIMYNQTILDSFLLSYLWLKRLNACRFCNWEDADCRKLKFFVQFELILMDPFWLPWGEIIGRNDRNGK